MSSAHADVRRPSLAELTRYFLALGTTGFGGPIALVGYMERDFVDRKHWVTAQELKDGLAFSQLAPGPLAAQLAIYLGWLCGGVRGATVAGVAFIGPSFVMVVVLAMFYRRFGGMAWLQGAFYGVGAAVIAIIARSALKLTRGSLGRDRLLWLLFVVTAIVTAAKEAEVLWLFVLCGVVAMAVRAPHASRLSLAWMMSRSFDPIVVVASPVATAGAVFVYFASAGLFVFGSGLAIVPFLYDGVVEQYHWLTEREFLDAVAIALVTPGPVVITVAFIGYLVAGLLGAVAAAAGVFAPVYVITLLVAPHYDRLKTNRNVRAFVDGVTASAIGAIAGAAFVLGRRAIVDMPTAAIAASTLVVLLSFRRAREPVVIVLAGVVGVLVKRGVS